MTLFLLLVTMASLMPVTAIAVQASHLKPSSTALGSILALLLGALQLVAHHKLMHRWQPRLTGDRKAGPVRAIIVTAYYVSIVAIGMLCSAAAVSIARALP